jgi:hypothetical protein
MRKEGEWRILEIGSPKRLVKRDIWPVGPTSHLVSMSSTTGMSFFGSNSLTTSITLFFSIHQDPQNHSQETKAIDVARMKEIFLLFVYSENQLTK